MRAFLSGALRSDASVVNSTWRMEARVTAALGIEIPTAHSQRAEIGGIKFGHKLLFSSR